MLCYVMLEEEDGRGGLSHSILPKAFLWLFLVFFFPCLSFLFCFLCLYLLCFLSQTFLFPVFLFFIFMYFIVFVFLPLSFSDFLILSLPGATFLSYCPKVSWPYFSFLFKLHFFALTCPCQDLLFPCQDLSRFVL